MLRKSIIILLIFVMTLSPIATYGQSQYIDKSNLANGTINVDYKGNKSNKIAIARVTKENQTYDYVLSENNNIPLQLGNGRYSISIFENVVENKFKQVVKEELNVELVDKNSVYLQSIQMINWNDNMEVVEKTKEVTKDTKTDMEKVKAIYDYIIKNIKYDNKKALSVANGYIPDADKTLSSQSGICYDYASLFAVMARFSGVPTKLVMGYKNDIKDYHAWNEVLIDNEWKIVDTTYDASMKLYMFKNKDEYKIVKHY